ncbi:multidrug resistance-associated protein 1 [Plakobranchus ocellatus]|uniref:ABC-type glutathione-S-conjugate transporter n=1 Tax=Plakobranchus ocellatus TaxID=259542 RepID=A0AAV4DW26_9GAST|nr:multidrug resistance-associated protein 1 [Plakobranchus ocellatus]
MIVVMKDGQITEMGTYEELLAHDGPFAQFLKEHLTQEQMDGVGEDEDPEVANIKDSMWGRIELLTSDAATSADESRPLRQRRKGVYENALTKSQIQRKPKEIGLMKPGEKLISVEVLAKGRVKSAVYLKYVQAAGVIPLSLAMVAYCAFQTVSVLTNYWLTDWTQDENLANSSNSAEVLESANDRYLSVYAVFGLFQGLLLMIYLYLYWRRMVIAGKHLHSQMMYRLFRAPVSFFDTTPIGRILNRCSRDIEIIDNILPIICRDFLNTFGSNCITMLVILIQTPVFGAVLIPVIALFILILRFYVPTSRQLRRIEHITRSPIYTHFSESVSGASTIRAYGASNRFLLESKRRLDYNVAYFFAASMALRWLSVNLDTLANLVIFFSGVLQIVTPSTTAGETGLVLSYALQISGSLPWMVRQVADFETNIVSVERIKEYSEVAQEADWIESARRPLPTWPSKGVIQFNNFSMRYREGLDLVIKGMTIRIEGGEKVGIVGRTGAGKSSLSLSLFRLVEAASGSIMVDGVNIADIGLHDLRSRITILPQDPVLFSGTLRMNLDPFNEFNEDDLWTALERAHLRDFVYQLPLQLDYHCGQEGHNLSVGQRQLVCLARTLLRKCRVLVLDEATAAVDIQTDALIQSTVRLAFQGCTVLAIAHRLNTILDYDKVIVMNAGTIQEYDSPSALLENPQSAFYAMAVDANLV